MIRISRRFAFEMAHALQGHDGLCSHIHGHSYKLIVALEGEPLDEPGNPKDGMVMDYADLKAWVYDKILVEFDHALVLRASHPMLATRVEGMRIVRTKYQPTCENLILDFVHRMTSGLPPGTSLHSVELWETESNYATWVRGE